MVSRSEDGLKLPELPGKHGFGDSLWLQVRDADHRSWLFRYKVNGRGREMGLGPVSTVSIDQARDAVRRWRALLAAGGDPIAARKADTKAQEAKRGALKCFEVVACECMSVREVLECWVPRTRKTWESSLTRYVYKHFGKKPVCELGVEDVSAVLKPVWTRVPVAAEKLRGQMEVIFQYAIDEGWRADGNPARFKGGLDKKLPKHKKNKEHHPALAWTDIGRFMKHLREIDGISARALEFLALTVTRSGSVRNAKWEEIDFTRRVWTIPAQNMKGGETFRVPLSAQAIALLESVKPHPCAPGAYIFPSPKKNRAMSDMALSMQMRRMSKADDQDSPHYPDAITGKAAVPHGLRSTFRDWCFESQPFPREVVEQVLAHVGGDAVETAYKRGHAIKIRAAIMQVWGNVCENGAEEFDPDEYVKQFSMKGGRGFPGVRREVQEVGDLKRLIALVKRPPSIETKPGPSLEPTSMGWRTNLPKKSRAPDQPPVAQPAGIFIPADLMAKLLELVARE